MELHIVGISHNDPRCPGLLNEHLRVFANQWNGEPPAFIVTEWGPDSDDVIEAQRNEFRRLVTQEDPLAVAESLTQRADLRPRVSDVIRILKPYANLLAEAIHYEDQIPRLLFPDTAVFGLDEGPMSSTYAHGRLKGYVQPLFERLAPVSALNFLQTLTEIVWSDPRKCHSRDLRLAKLTSEKMRESAKATSTWALSVVGANHADDQDPQSMISILLADGWNRSRCVLRPS